MAPGRRGPGTSGPAEAPPPGGGRWLAQRGRFAAASPIGITRGTTAGHVARAALEGIALQVADVLDVMRADAGGPITELRVDGGAAANDLLMQLQADVTGVPVVRPEITETTALGAATLAGLAVGVWRSGEELDRRWQVQQTFEPAMDPGRVDALRSNWNRALQRARDWAEP